MKPALVLLLLVGAALSGSQLRVTGNPTPPEELPPTGQSRFRFVDVFIDSHRKPMAAYQVELWSAAGNMNVTGIEGGDHPAFSTPPYHDDIAMIRNRVIIAAYNTGNDLPAGKTRVSRIMVEVRGQRDPQYQCKLVVAGSPEGKPIPADVTIAEGEAK